MRILPITVSTDLIQPILDDRKLRTRRRLAHQPTDEWMQNTRQFSADGTVFDFNGKQRFWIDGGRTGEVYPPCKPRDILYVREEHFAWGYWEDVEGEFTKTGKQKKKFIDRAGYALFPDTFGHNARTTKNGLGWHKRLARFMPKKYARIFLEVTDIRVERLQDITEDEALLEGVLEYEDGTFKNYSTQKGLRSEDGVECLMAIGSFQTLINKVNGPGIWDANPWVWVISFKRVERPANF